MGRTIYIERREEAGTTQGRGKDWLSDAVEALAVGESFVLDDGAVGSDAHVRSRVCSIAKRECIAVSCSRKGLTKQIRITRNI